MPTDYPFPVNRLLNYGSCEGASEWPDYLELGFSREHIPALIRMALDDELNWADSDSLEVWAPVHAWRTLGQLRAVEAIEPLMRLFHELEDSDWVGEELPVVYGMIGPPAIPALARYLTDGSHGLYPRASAAHSLECIGNAFDTARRECIDILAGQLDLGTGNDPTLNGFLISSLVDLEAAEAIENIRAAFQKECVDFSIMGDVEEVEIELGLRDRRSTPATYPTIADTLFPKWSRPPSPVVRREPKIGRNDPCPCGSGKKYKKCCLGKDG